MSKRFAAFKEDVGSEVSSRRWFRSIGALPLGIGVVAVRRIVGVLLGWRALDGWRSVYPRWSDVVLLALAACSFVNAAVLLGTLVRGRKLWRRRSREAGLEAERWEAFRRYLTDFPRLDEAPPASLALWERFLVYGIAFGIADRVLQAAHLAHARGSWRRRARSTGSHPAATSAPAPRRSRSATSRPASALRSHRRPPAREVAEAASRAEAEAAAAAGAAASADGASSRHLRLPASQALSPKSTPPGSHVVPVSAARHVLSPRTRRELVERDRPGRRDVERLGAAGKRDRRPCNVRCKLSGQPAALGPEQEGQRGREVELRQRRAAVGDERDLAPRRLVPTDDRHAEDRARRGAQGLRRERVGAAVRQRHARAEGVGRADQRADVARVGDSPQREADLPDRGRKIDAGGRLRSRGRGAAASRRTRAAGATFSPATRQVDRLEPARRARRRRGPRPRTRTGPSRRGACAPRGACATRLSVSLSRDSITRPVSRPAAVGSARRARR